MGYVGSAEENEDEGLLVLDGEGLLLPLALSVEDVCGCSGAECARATGAITQVFPP